MPFARMPGGLGKHGLEIEPAQLARAAEDASQLRGRSRMCGQVRSWRYSSMLTGLGKSDGGLCISLQAGHRDGVYNNVASVEEEAEEAAL